MFSILHLEGSMDLEIIPLGVEKVHRSTRLPDVFLIHDLDAGLF